MSVVLLIAGIAVIAGGVFLMLRHRIIVGGIVVLLLGLVLAFTGWFSGADVRVTSDQPADSALPTLPVEATLASSP